MVAVMHGAPESASPEALAAWNAQVGRALAPAERDAIAAVAEHALALYGDRCTADGEPWLDRALATAAIVAGLKLDTDSVHAAILVGAPHLDGFDSEKLAQKFGAEVEQLVAGVARMGAIRAAQIGAAAKEDRDDQAENLRKMLLAMVGDIRVVLIKLAERTQALRFLVGSEGDNRLQAARETQDLFAPLANRLGVWQLKWELEDLSLRALEPHTYKQIAELVDERRLDRAHYIEDVKATLKRELAAAGLHADVSGRPKHIYSIWNKMRRKHAGIDSLYDIRAVRILVESIKDCYAALGLVHNLWTPLAREFDDYIAKPKANGYKSLHTAVIGPEGKPLEVQIRTHDMHQHSEYGVAAHWRYKEGAAGRRDPGYDEKIAWLRQVLDWKDAVADAGEWLQQFKSSLFTDTIYVLTPQGRVIDLPRGATPVDFAYAVHTSLGHRCRGARVDGAMVPLHTALDQRPARGNRRREAGRPIARLAQPRARLRREPSRAHEGAAVVQIAAARGDDRARAIERRARASARRHDRAESRRRRGKSRVRQTRRFLCGRCARRRQRTPGAKRDSRRREARRSAGRFRGRGHGLPAEQKQQRRRRHSHRRRRSPDDGTRR